MQALSGVTRNRIANEAHRVQAAGLPLQAIHPQLWEGNLQGAGRWKRQTFTVRIFLPDGYPSKAAIPNFVTKPKPPHPNISPQGFVCLNLLWSSWSPTFNLVTIWDLLEWLFENPDYSKGFVPDGYIASHVGPLQTLLGRLGR